MHAAAAVLSLLFAFRVGQAPAPVQQQAADVKTDAAKSTGPPTQHALQTPDLEAFFDGVIPLQLERSDIAGASVLVMQNDQVLLEKGYGYADLKSKKPVDPATTIFRLASISKLFTWVSVMQLEEQGKLDLDTDINQYLDFQIRPAFGKAITLRNLMTHTGGFEETVRDVIVTNPEDAQPLRNFLMRNQPNRMFAPGVVPAYSNYGVGLAGYIVQRVSGEPYEGYVAHHIFGPLKMVHSTFYQPPPSALKNSPSQGYPEDTEKPVIGFEIFNPVPAGGLSSTAADMGRFGQALLNGGSLEGVQILKPETLAKMWGPQFRASEQMPPMCMGFYQDWRNEMRWIGHEGDLVAFHSLFMLEPSQKLILFISYNSAGGGRRTRPEIIDMFTDRYFPAAGKQTFLTLPRKELDEIEGAYESTRAADSTKLKLLGLMSQRMATVDKDGVLHIENNKDLRNHPIQWKPIGKDLWQEVDGQEKLFAIRDQNGQIVRLAYDFPGVQSRRVPWYETSKYIFGCLAASVLILLAVVIWPLFRLGRRIFLSHRPRLAPQPGTHWLPFTTKIAAGAWLAVLGFIATAMIVTGGGDAMPPTSAWDKYMVLLNAMSMVALLFSVLAVISASRVWLRPDFRRITQVKQAVVAAACIFLSWFALHWHLLGPIRL
jgi:CubicO group peptidase (beta-lactamase class C family)